MSWLDLNHQNKYNLYRHDTQQNDTQHNDIQHNDTRHNGIQHNDIQHNDTQHKELTCYSQLNATQHSNILQQVLLCRVSLS